MPIYEYVCETCKKKSEVIILHEPEPDVCPLCNQKTLKKVPSVCNHKMIWTGINPKNFYDSDGNWIPDKSPKDGF